MRTYYRIVNPDGSWTWTQVSTDAQGFDDYVWIVTLIQTLQLGRGESPFYSNFGIPAQQSVVQQVAPDYFVSLTQQQFAPHFASLTVARITADRQPHYRINVTTHKGVTRQLLVSAQQGQPFIVGESTLGGGDILGG